MFNIIQKRNIFFIISAAILLLGIIFFFIFGFNMDIDFGGGTQTHVNIGKEFDNKEITQVVSDAIGMAPSSVQKVGENGYEVSIKTRDLTAEQRTALMNGLKEKYGIDDSALLSSETISPVVGRDLANQAIISIVLVSILILIYISFRFDFHSALAAVISLLQVILSVLAIYIIFRLPINLTFVAAILTILGYAINDTVVVFDRIRENNKFAKRESFADVANRSIWQTMNRSINTSVTTLIPIVCLYVMGVTSIREFALPLIIGIVIGTCSSIFIASPLWVVFRGKSGDPTPKKKKKPAMA